MLAGLGLGDRAWCCCSIARLATSPDLGAAMANLAAPAARPHDGARRT